MDMYFFFFNDTATTEIYTLSLHDALPIFVLEARLVDRGAVGADLEPHVHDGRALDAHGDLHRALHVKEFTSKLPDRKSTRLNSSHANISYAVFCLKKKQNRSILSYNSYP